MVSVYDRGTYEDSYYISMELVEGSSLRDLINQGLSIEEAVEVTRQVLSAAEFAHEQGIVHRDLKPLNVLIDRAGRVRVTDFGIARAGGSEITRTGSVMGTAQYLSPEQAQGMEVTAAADIYSIGIILFEMLCGHVPFDGDNAVAIAMKQVGEDPPVPSSINPEGHPGARRGRAQGAGQGPGAALRLGRRDDGRTRCRRGRSRLRRRSGAAGRDGRRRRAPLTASGGGSAPRSRSS